VYLEGAIIRQSGLSREHQGPRAVLNALERLAGGYASECDRVRRDLSIAESQLRDYQARLGKPFTHETYLSDLTGLRDQLKSKLSATGHGSGEEEGPGASELAERIKALKAANSVEGAPQRVGQRQSSAAEPVTARIRRRQGGNTASDQAIESDAAPEAGAAQPPASSQNSSAELPMTFRERILRERQRNDAGTSPP